MTKPTETISLIGLCVYFLFIATGGVYAASTAENLKWRLYDDGTFDIVTGGNSPSLLKCFPAFDDRSLTPKSVTVTRNDEGGQTVYQLLDGSVILNFKKNEDSIYIETILKGFSNAPHWVYPLAQGQISGAGRFFKQGLGFGGPSGVFKFSPAASWHNPNEIKEDVWSYDSFMTSALIAEEGITLAAGAYEHRNYLQRSTYHNRQHRTGLVDKSPATNVIIYEAGFSTECIPIKSDELKLPAIHFISADSPFEALHHLAQNIAKASKPRLGKPPRYHWDTWYEYQQDYNMAKLDDFLAGLKSIKPRIPLQGMMIDAGYCPLGDWIIADENDYPGGLKAAFKRITDSGYKPGGYIGPFMVSSQSQLYKQHPDWVLHDVNGKPMLESKGKPIIDNKSNYEERYFLDTSNPEAFEYLRQECRTFRSLGATFYKIDFMDWGFKDSTEVKRHTPGKTSVQYFVDILEMIRQEIGEDAYWIECISPLAPSIGYVDAMRLAYDSETRWTPSSNVQNMIAETYAGQYFNNVFWANDTDVVYLRNEPGLSDEEVLSIAYWDGMVGGVIATSERFHKLRQDRLDLWRFIQPGERTHTAVFPFWYGNYKFHVAVVSYPERNAWAVLVMNPSSEIIKEVFDLKQVIGKDNAYCFEWSAGKNKPLGTLSSLSQELKPHHSILYYISTENTPPPADVGLAGIKIAGLGEQGVNN